MRRGVVNINVSFYYYVAIVSFSGLFYNLDQLFFFLSQIILLKSSELFQGLFIANTSLNHSRLLDQSFKGDVIKTQEFPDILRAIGRNPVGYPLAWQFLRENWNKLVQK